jgi:hypothetical protein
VRIVYFSKQYWDDILVYNLFMGVSFRIRFRLNKVKNPLNYK